MALRSEGDGFAVVGSAESLDDVAVAYCFVRCFCVVGVGAILRYAAVFDLVLRLRWVCVLARGARLRH